LQDINRSELKESYSNSEPYSHIILDGFLKEEVFEKIQNELLSSESNFNELFVDGMQTKKTISTGDDVPPLISLIASKFASPVMLRYLENLTGLEKLIPDPYYNTDYGYYHIVGAGGVLGSHVDHGRHNSLNIPHVLNIVVYISAGWDEKDGGALCLYDSTGKNEIKKVVSKGNRAVIFTCTPSAYHGVQPVVDSCVKRRHSLYFAYYTVDNQSSAVAIEGFPSIQNADSNDDDNSNYGTYFVVPFPHLFKPKNWIHLRVRLIYLIKYIFPPCVVDVMKYLSKSIRHK
jgi:Rps23 Pro-64 3,4-dihydroxylase Tpa1-like proline 4-hydroxylase